MSSGNSEASPAPYQMSKSSIIERYLDRFIGGKLFLGKRGRK